MRMVMDEFLYNLFERKYCYICKNIVQGRVFPEAIISDMPSFSGSAIYHFRKEHQDVYCYVFGQNKKYCLRCGMFNESQHVCDGKYAFYVDNFERLNGHLAMGTLEIPITYIDLSSEKHYALSAQIMAKVSQYIGKEVISGHILSKAIENGSIATRTAIASSDVDVLLDIDTKEPISRLRAREMRQFIQEVFPNSVFDHYMYPRDRYVITVYICDIQVEFIFTISSQVFVQAESNIAHQLEYMQSLTDTERYKLLRGKHHITEFVRDFPNQFSKKMIVDAFQRYFLLDKRIRPSLTKAFAGLAIERANRLFGAAAGELAYADDC